MDPPEITTVCEKACHFKAIEALMTMTFGPGRFARTAFRLREGIECEKKLSFVALKKIQIIGSVRITRIIIGIRQSLILGPLAVHPMHQNKGIGSKLMRASLKASRNTDHELVLLVGDESYYKPFGFKKVPHGQIILPGPVDPARLLYYELKKSTLKKFSGLAKPISHCVK